MIRVGQVGVGQWGQNHLKILSEMNGVDYCGFCDTDSSKFKEYRWSVMQHNTLSLLIKQIDALIITTPTSTHYEIAKLALENGVHVFIEKPVCSEIWQAEELAKLANGLIIQVGHIERFNPAYQRLKKENFNPRYIMCHRYTETPDRCKDVSIVMDLMIHDIDLILDLTQGNLVSIEAKYDGLIVSATLKFTNSTEVTLFSGILRFKSRKMIVSYQDGRYCKLDFLEKTNDNLLELELKAFIESVRENKLPLVGIDDAIKSLKVAKEIEELIDLPKVSQN